MSMPYKNESINKSTNQIDDSGEKENSVASRLDRTRAVIGKKLDKSKMNVSNFIPTEKIEFNKKKVEEVVVLKEESRVKREEEERKAKLAEKDKKSDDSDNAFTGFFKNMFMFCGNDDKKKKDDGGGCFGERPAEDPRMSETMVDIKSQSQ